MAETWDGYLNDINGGHVTALSAVRALDAARSGPVDEGSVGGGTGMNCYDFKGGTGTASRRVQVGSRQYTVGALMQANFGSRPELVVAGRYLGEVLREDNPLDDTDWLAPPGAGSCITVIATDAPLLPGQCKALARRVPLGLAQDGHDGQPFLRRPVPGVLGRARRTSGCWTACSARSQEEGRGRSNSGGSSSCRGARWMRCTRAVVQSVEEAVLNVLAASTTMIGRDGHRSPGFPAERLPELLAL